MAGRRLRVVPVVTARAPAVAAAGALLAAAAVAGDLPQFGYDAQHSGAVPSEAAISPATVGTLRLAHPPVQLPAVADGAPAYAAGVPTAGGTVDLLLVTTTDGTLVAVDAARGAVAWSFRPAAGPWYTTSSPAVGPDRRFVYTYGLDGRVHKVCLAAGTEVTSHGWPEVATLKPDVEKGSSALTVAAAGGRSYLYVASGGYLGDRGDYQGHVTTIDLATGAQRVFNANCSDLPCHLVEHGKGGARRPVPTAPGSAAPSGRGPASSTIRARGGSSPPRGNGPFDGDRGGMDWGDSILALHPDGPRGRPVDGYTPRDHRRLDRDDLDLGSTAPAGCRVAHPAAQSGKDVVIRLIDLADLSGRGGPGHVGGALQVVAMPQGGEVLTAPAVWRDPDGGEVWMFVANRRGISGLVLDVDADGGPRLRPVWTRRDGGTSPVVAGGVALYASYQGLRALDPRTGAVLWRDGRPDGIHWQSPIVADGRVAVADNSGRLLVYTVALSRRGSRAAEGRPGARRR